ncbi:DNA repair protein RecN [Caulobacter sp. CCUG 60055]|uniref:DNA repair protein RecN n=1 Tax=Caulobacter sp. CCUG 60055 TaxID=2100090 RepID=UPI001FA78111|nr:DNA repair protein RecN [Caulobacter sp. CCUG 60055]MCI3181189.1 DNA repair protein RecN [Caulobacter sp. CCUG 60055]
MLIGLAIRDVVLIESLDLSIGPGLTALTGETGAGKSIILDALGLATGARADAGLVRRGAAQASAAAIFALPADHAVWASLDDKGLAYERDEDLVLRRVVSADGRSRAFVNDQATSVAVLRELGAMLIEVHGQHETVGLLDARNHRPLLDVFGGCGPELAATGEAWSVWRAADERARVLREQTGRAAAELEEMTLRLGELDRLDPREGEETRLAEERALLGAAEKALADIASARDSLGDNLSGCLAQAFRALERARERAVQAGASAEGSAATLIARAAEAVDRALVEAVEAQAAVDAAAAAFDFEPDRLEKTEERLFALRAMARKLGVAVEDLPGTRVRLAAQLGAVENAEEALKAADAEAAAARKAYAAAAAALTAARRAAGDRLAKAVEAELPPLKLDKARFRVAVEPLGEDRAGPSGADRVEFEVATNPGAPFGGLGVIASGGELARFALALKAALAARGDVQPLMIFDEVDQGVGGAVADAVGLRLKRLAAGAQVLVVTHSAQVAARAEAHWRVSKAGGEEIRTAVEVLTPAAREEELARMLSGSQVTEAARAAARALMDA